MTAQQQNTATDKKNAKLDNRKINLDNREAKLNKRQAALEIHKQELDKKEAELKKLKEELDKRSAELTIREGKLDKNGESLPQNDSNWKKLFQDIDKKISTISSNMGKIIEHVIGDRGDIVNKFRLQGYEITQSSRNVVFDNKNLDARGEIDILLEGNNVAILIEIKTHLEKGDITKHVARLDRYRKYANARNDKRIFYGAVAGALQEKEIVDCAHSKGLYVIHQFGETDEKLLIPKNFKPKEW